MTYKHTYSDYVNHILNTSPSKKTYSFTKAQRFQQQRPFDHHDIPAFQHTQQHQFKHSYKYQNHYRHERQRQPSRQNGFIKISDKIYAQKNKKKSFQTSRHQIKSKSPHKKIENNFNTTANTAQLKRRQSRRQLSPSKQLSPGKYSPLKSGSNQMIEGKKGHSKTYVQYLQEIDHPLKKMTIGGYYPTGVEISPTGRYVNSKIKNVQSYTFSKSPSSKARYQFIQGNQSTLGPGYYNSFSQFGQFKAK